MSTLAKYIAALSCSNKLIPSQACVYLHENYQMSKCQACTEMGLLECVLDSCSHSDKLNALKVASTEMYLACS